MSDTIDYSAPSWWHRVIDAAPLQYHLLGVRFYGAAAVITFRTLGGRDTMRARIQRSGRPDHAVRYQWFRIDCPEHVWVTHDIRAINALESA